jgi:hypothetical protein
VSSPRTTRSSASFGVHHTTLGCVDPKAGDDDSAAASDDIDRIESELVLLELEDLNQPDIANLCFGDGCAESEAHSPPPPKDWIACGRLTCCVG